MAMPLFQDAAGFPIAAVALACRSAAFFKERVFCTTSMAVMMSHLMKMELETALAAR